MKLWSPTGFWWKKWMYFSSILDILGYVERSWLTEFPIHLALSPPSHCRFWKKKVFSGKAAGRGGRALPAPPLSVSVATGSGPENLTSASWKVTWEGCSQSEPTLVYSTLPGAVLLSRVISTAIEISGTEYRIQKYNHTCMINWFSIHYSSTSGTCPMPTNRRMDKWTLLPLCNESLSAVKAIKVLKYMMIWMGL